MLARIAEYLHRQPALYMGYKRVRVFVSRLRYRLWAVHPTSLVRKPAEISSDLKTGAYCFVGCGARIAPHVELGNYVMLGPEVAIVGGDHRVDQPGTPICFSGRPLMPKTVIEDDVWVGQRALIKAGVRIGRGAIVAMGSVVTKDVEPYTVVGGVPARFLRRRFRSREEEEKHDAMLRLPPQRGEYCRPKRAA